MIIKNKLKKYYSVYLALLPILSLYKIDIPILSIGEIGLIFFSILTLMILITNKKIAINKIDLTPVFFFIAILFITCFSILFIDGQVSVIDIQNRFIRLALWAFTISFIGYFLIDFKILFKWLIRISILATFYIVIQYILWYGLNIYLPSVLDNFLIKPLSEGYADAQGLIQYYNNFYFRPASFFGEPAFYSYYVLIGIVLTLYGSKKFNWNKIFLAVFFSLGIFISTSTSGIYLVVLLWLYYFYKNTTAQNSVLKLMKLSILLIPVLALFILITINFNISNELTETLNRIISKPFDFNSSSRLGESYNLFNLLDGVQKFIGAGFGNEDIYLDLKSVYYNSLTVVLLSTGYLGLFVFILFSVKLIINKNPINFMLALIYIFLCFTSGILYSSFAMTYLSIVLYNRNLEEA